MHQVQRLTISRETKEKRFRLLHALATVIAMAVIAVAPAMANTITFAQYSDVSGGQDWNITTAGSGWHTPASPCSTTISVTSIGFNSLFIFVPGSAWYRARGCGFHFHSDEHRNCNCGVACATGAAFTQGGYRGSCSYGGLPVTYAGLTLLTAPSRTPVSQPQHRGWAGGVFSGSHPHPELACLRGPELPCSPTQERRLTSFVTPTSLSRSALLALIYQASHPHQFSLQFGHVRPNGVFSEPAFLTLTRWRPGGSPSLAAYASHASRLEISNRRPMAFALIDLGAGNSQQSNSSLRWNGGIVVLLLDYAMSAIAGRALAGYLRTGSSRFTADR